MTASQINILTTSLSKSLQSFNPCTNSLTKGRINITQQPEPTSVQSHQTNTNPANTHPIKPQTPNPTKTLLPTTKV